jgi:hypothetical protein
MKIYLDPTKKGEIKKHHSVSDLTEDRKNGRMQEWPVPNTVT